MSLARALNQPGIRKLISGSLGKGSLCLCIRVCKSWYELFCPLLWEDVQVGVRPVDGIRVGPPYYNLVRYSDLVRSLKVHSLDAQVLDVEFPQLVRLDTCIIQQSIILLCPSLVELHIQGPCDYYAQGGEKAETAAWNAVSQLQHLRYLSLESCYLGPHCVDEFWKACRNLETLEIFSVTIERLSFLINMTFPKLRKLHLREVIGLEVSDELFLIGRCPKLTELKWISHDREWFQETSMFAECVMTGVWPGLKRLDLHGVILDEQMTMICKGMQKATKLVLASTVQTVFLPTACQQLKRHFGSLIQLDLRRAGVDSSTVCYILCSCPRLEEFIGDKVLARHVVDQGSWNCSTSLRVLAIRIVFQEGEYTLQRLVFQRLSILRRLEVLSDDNHDILDLDPTRVGLDFRLMSGMGALASLKQMRVIRFNATQRMDMDDARWMAHHWKQLEIICGDFHPDSSINGSIKAFFATRSVHCATSREDERFPSPFL
ncbi:hypothetical protein B0O80DRAFT_493196 [Mortierella sp. GBAus27b]|nr:hypothetical protein BGX31_010084 [Mortierella sp. GBA43]KAI8362180.1 hypothetical protein B0O80DRAFT_493196 [Mortierella sp. GBAus27b]